MTKRYASAAQLSERYDVSQRTIWRWSRNGILPPPERITEACTRWNLSEIEQFEAERSRERGAA
jgi:predicted DNA-binding transcriptional regulator AlpA